MNDPQDGRQPVIQVAKDIAKKRDPNEPVMLSTGVRAILRPVSASLIGDVTSRILDPAVPTWTHPDKDREEPNPHDPTYLSLMEDAAQRRGQASVDAVIMFGVELVDPMPPDSEWLTKLQFMEKRNMLDLSGYDLSDLLDKEFLYKRYVAVGNQDIVTIGGLSGLNREALQKAENTF